MKAARQPQWHGIFKRETWPIRYPLTAKRVALHQGQLCFDDAGGYRRIISATMLSLHHDAFSDPVIVHNAVTECFCHIALSVRGP